MELYGSGERDKVCQASQTPLINWMYSLLGLIFSRDQLANEKPINYH